VKDLPLISAFKGDNICIVAGSVWEADMNVLIPAVNALSKPVKMIIAPHEINMEEIKLWCQRLEGSSVLYSDFVKGNQEEANYLFINNIGMLSSLYRYGDMAYIGGSFGAGLHNILEAATFGLPVTFGDKGYKKFQEAKDLILEGGAVAVSGDKTLTKLIEKWCDPAVRNKSGELSKSYVARQTGATSLVMAKVEEKLG
jgi:3-deoxy-D-manno-octulosonic-acid transferase